MPAHAQALAHALATPTALLQRVRLRDGFHSLTGTCCQRATGCLGGRCAPCQPNLVRAFRGTSLPWGTVRAHRGGSAVRPQRWYTLSSPRHTAMHATSSRAGQAPQVVSRSDGILIPYAGEPEHPLHVCGDVSKSDSSSLGQETPGVSIPVRSPPYIAEHVNLRRRSLLSPSHCFLCCVQSLPPMHVHVTCHHITVRFRCWLRYSNRTSLAIGAVRLLS
jgi:hypothetical protein